MATEARADSSWLLRGQLQSPCRARTSPSFRYAPNECLTRLEAIARQRIHIGIVHAGRTLTVESADHTFRIYGGDQLLAETGRTTTKPIARFKVRKPEPPRQRHPAACVQLPGPLAVGRQIGPGVARLGVGQGLLV